MPGEVAEMAARGDRAAILAKKAYQTGKSIRQVAMEEAVMSDEALDRILSVKVNEPLD